MGSACQASPCHPNDKSDRSCCASPPVGQETASANSPDLNEFPSVPTAVVGNAKQYPDGSMYTGGLENGLREGHGIWVSKEGVYEGQWRKGTQDGRGRQRWSDGRIYEGQFRAGVFHGQGTMTWMTSTGKQSY